MKFFERRRSGEKTTALKYASPTHPRRTLGGVGKAKDNLCNRVGEMHCGSMSLGEWSNAAYGDQSTKGKRRSGYVIGLMSSMTGLRRVLQRAPKFSRMLVRSSLCGEDYAPSEMVGHMLLLEDFFGPF